MQNSAPFVCENITNLKLPLCSADYKKFNIGLKPHVSKNENTL